MNMDVGAVVQTIHFWQWNYSRVLEVSWYRNTGRGRCWKCSVHHTKRQITTHTQFSVTSKPNLRFQLWDESGHLAGELFALQINWCWRKQVSYEGGEYQTLWNSPVSFWNSLAVCDLSRDFLSSVPSYSASSQTTNWPEMQHCTMGHRDGPAKNHSHSRQHTDTHTTEKETFRFQLLNFPNSQLLSWSELLLRKLS